jgi:hypothetical protein
MGLWQTTWVYAEIWKTYNAKTVQDTTKRAEIKTLLDWALTGAIRMVNEQAATGAWRYQCQYDTIGTRGAWPGNSDGLIDNKYDYWNGYDHGGFANWDLKAQYRTGYPPPSVTGTWMVNGDTGRSGYSGFLVTTAANKDGEFDYCTTVWPWICMAAEADLPGASQMWTTVMAGITNWGQWLDGFAMDMEDGIWPRNKPLDK